MVDDFVQYEKDKGNLQPKQYLDRLIDEQVEKRMKDEYAILLRTLTRL